MRSDFRFKRFSQFEAAREKREKVKHQVKLLSVKTGKHFKEIARISQKPHESLLSFISVNYNTNIICFYFLRRKNKPAPEDFWECDVSIATLTRRIHCKYDKFYLKYGRGFIQFSIIIVLLLLNQSCSAEGEDKKYIYNQQK